MNNILQKNNKLTKSKSTKSKSTKSKSKKQIGGNSVNLTPVTKLLLKMTLPDNLSGWDVMSKQKPVGTLPSTAVWFNYKTFTESQKCEFLSILSNRASFLNGYQCDIEIYAVHGKLTFFYIREFLNVICELVGCTFDEAIECISNISSSFVHRNKMLVIHLAFGDYYKKSFKQIALKNRRFLPLLIEYNKRVGLPHPDSIPQYTKDY